ncbi:CHAT domain-containing protein [Prochlorothrix hollandica]|uniref:CHAT domain-containing protein n=1 Tax=Prochlorothrix hollandica TaxID=1223 RepID=UPI00333FE33C
MAVPEAPCLTLAIAPLTHGQPGHWVTWVTNAPYPGGYVLHDRPWPEDLSQTWQAWQALFSLQASPTFASTATPLPPDFPGEETGSYSSRLMQHLGLRLWQWLFAGSIHTGFSQSQGIAIGQGTPLRLQLELRDPNLVMLPWEIMQPQRGKQAISVSQQILFSRTTSDVDPLVPPPLSQSLNVLLVLGQATHGQDSPLQLQQEANILIQSLTRTVQPSNILTQGIPVPRRVDLLVQPTRSALVRQLESGNYNLFFYAGHGVTAPEGGRLLLNGTEVLSGTELAQVLVRCKTTLAVFNACWGAQMDYLQAPDTGTLQAVPRSSLAETLIHHGVPAVLGMRDVIADEEALTFVQSLAQALSDRHSIDQAVAIARQQLLTLYRFNQPTWTLPVLYMHPEFDGRLIKPLEGATELPTNVPFLYQGNSLPVAEVRSLADPLQVWPVRGGLMRVGRKSENDVVLQEQWVSQNHAEIIYRTDLHQDPSYFLRDFSRFGTLVTQEDGWQKIHHQEVPLLSGMQMRFGSPEGATLEFVIHC